MFFTLYFLLTGLHSLHVIAGTGVLLWLAFFAARGAFSSQNYSAVENGGLYWDLVDLIWIFDYPRLYFLGCGERSARRPPSGRTKKQRFLAGLPFVGRRPCSLQLF